MERTNTGQAASLLGSAATFRRGTIEKASFFLLSLFDLTLTVVAIRLGFAELNPFVRFLVGVPVLLIIAKLVVPLIIAWLVPGRLLLPSVALLAFAVIWNVKELVIFLV